MKLPRSATTPWFRHPEPWLLFAAPIAAVIAGGITWWIAAHTNNSLVVDDYYKQGKAINQTLARDQRSAEFGLRATLAVDRASQTASLHLTASSSSVVLPDAIPVIMAGERLAMTSALSGVLVAEFIQRDQGIGALILTYTRNLNMASAFACILTLTAIGFLIFKGMEMLDHHVAYWKNEAGLRRMTEKRARAWAARRGGVAHA